METVRFVGLDVHKDSIAIAVADSTGGEPSQLAIVPNDTAGLIKRLCKLGPKGQLRCCYEAGPTGYGLCRDLRAAKIRCTVVAPSLVPRAPGERIKTDRRDAAKLARFLRSDDLTEVVVPDSSTEAMRDLERAREDAKNAERVLRHQLQKFLLRHGRRYPEKTNWTQGHLRWIESQHFEHEAQQRVLTDALRAVQLAAARIEQLDKDIAELVEGWSMKPLVDGLQALRGIQLLTAVTIAAEVGNLRRFESAPRFMAYVGAVPGEHSSGERRHRTRITKTGNAHLRRVLVESAWCNRFKPSISKRLVRRQKDVSTEVRDIAWRAQNRLHSRYRRMLGRGACTQKTVVAMARELAGFVWAVGQAIEA
jgi:transposase